MTLTTNIVHLKIVFEKIDILKINSFSSEAKTMKFKAEYVRLRLGGAAERKKSDVIFFVLLS
jgi:hypothetical protein